MRAVTLSLPFFAFCAILSVPAMRFVSAYEVASRNLAPLPEVVAITAQVKWSFQRRLREERLRRDARCWKAERLETIRKAHRP